MSATANELVRAADLALRTPGRSSRSKFRRAGATRAKIGGGLLLGVLMACLIALPWALDPDSSWYYDAQNAATARMPPSLDSGLVRLFGTDIQGRPLLSRCLVGGAISLTIGVAAAAVAVLVGVVVGVAAGYRGGWIDSTLMRIVDILYGLPYILIIVLLKFAFEPLLTGRIGLSPPAANVVVMFLAIGSVSWLTMARVVRGQVMSLRGQPFVESARASGLTEWRIFRSHLLPNLVGSILVYATLTVPRAILEESFLSFLGVGVNPPLPTWGSLASEGLMPALNPINSRAWMLVFPCLLLAGTLFGLNMIGDGLRDWLDPKRDAAKI